ncbi:MAG: hypothetical protein L6Q26_01115 [Anaerolineales bacterium]|nr:hypothetical protein [Anaerolineales bacterium]NUQ84702.1 hypothetical protein [Anaerolineales bacterium]
MLDEKTGTLRTHPSPSVKLRASLLPLRTALILAERESPSRPRRVNTDEMLAMQLIARMQARYKRTHPWIKDSRS